MSYPDVTEIKLSNLDSVQDLAGLGVADLHDNMLILQRLVGQRNAAGGLAGVGDDARVSKDNLPDDLVYRGNVGRVIARAQFGGTDPTNAAGSAQAVNYTTGTNNAPGDYTITSTELWPNNQAGEDNIDVNVTWKDQLSGGARLASVQVVPNPGALVNNKIRVRFVDKNDNAVSPERVHVTITNHNDPL